MEDLEDIEDIMMVEYLESLEKGPKKTVYDRSKNDLENLNDSEFRERYRFNKNTIREIVTLLTPQLNTTSTRNRALTPSDKVLAAVRYFISGTKQKNVADLENMSQSSASRAVTDVAEALASHLNHYVKIPETEEERLQISQEFYHTFDFPDAIGALDCTLIKIICPGGHQAETFRSKKGFFALNVQTLSDSILQIRNLVVRPGSIRDNTIFDESDLKMHLETQIPRSYHILGDTGYPLRPYLLTPVLDPKKECEIRYNSAHAKARNVVERQYGVWKKRFACLQDILRCSIQNAELVIMATAVLHNIAIMMGDFFEEDPVLEDDDQYILGEWSADGIAKRNAVIRNYFSN